MGEKLHNMMEGHLSLSDFQELSSSSSDAACMSELNLTLTVLSCAPRILEIPNFLSYVEVVHLLLEAEKSLGMGEDDDLDTSTDFSASSSRAWLPRNHSPIID